MNEILNNKIFMQRCLQLAQNGIGNVAPNPMVGSVITFNDKIIGEGYHKQYGGPHAEVNAINNVKDKSLLSKSKLFVNLEPCSHFGKTPPCADLIIKYKIPEVYIGCKDTFSEVSGKGIQKLLEAGIKVNVGILENESRQINKRFFTFHEKKRPYIILKWAQTIDSYIDIVRKPQDPIQPFWITNETSRILVHKWRSEEDAIMVGTNTLKKDNPKLNSRDYYGESPVRVIIDKNLDIDRNLNVYDQTIKTIVFTQKHSQNQENIEYVVIDFEKELISSIINQLYIRNIQSIIVEGGTILLNSLIMSNLWDEIRLFIGNKTFGNGVKAPSIENLTSSKMEIIDDCQLLYYYNSK